MSETTAATKESEENTTIEHETEVGVSASGHSSFSILDEVIRKDTHISYGDRLILKAIQSVGLDIITAIRIYSGQTTEEPPTEGNDGVQDEQPSGSNETD